MVNCRNISERLGVQYSVQRSEKGLTLIELMVVIAIVGVLFSIAMPSYEKYKDRVNVAQAISDINSIAMALERYWVSTGKYPASLAEIGMNINDPWGHAYYYTNISGVKGLGAVRKDKNLVPINSDYDLYSAGKDGATSSPLTAKSSKDDVIRANNGAYIGLAENY